MNPTALRYALRHVTTWLVLGIGVLYAYLATVDAPNRAILTIGAAALITFSLGMFGACYDRAVRTQVREQLARDREATEAAIAESRANRRALDAIGSTRTPAQVVDSIEHLMDDTIRRLR